MKMYKGVPALSEKDMVVMMVIVVLRVHSNAKILIKTMFASPVTCFSLFRLNKARFVLLQACFIGIECLLSL